MSLLKHLFQYAYENHHHRGHWSGEHGNAYGSYQRYGRSHPEAVSMIRSPLKRFLKGGRKLLWVLAGLTAFMILVAVGVVAALLPLLYQAFDYVSQNGLKGAADMLTGLLQRLWEGAGK